MKKKILLGLTTITPGEWKNKVKEIDELGLKEIALFPTCLEYKERRELYQLLENTGLISIPHVHLREQDMAGRELDYLVERFKTQVFNIHAGSGAIVFLKQNEKYRDKIYVENTLMEDNFNEVLQHCAGVCLDLSHWEDFGFLKNGKGYKVLLGLLKKYKIGINHISAIKREQVHRHDKYYDLDIDNYSDHNLNELTELDYVRKYKNYLADIISIELENPLKRQLEVKKYLEKIIL